MCDFGDAAHVAAIETESDVHFDFDEYGLCAVISHGEQWERISIADDWQHKINAWREWYNQQKSAQRLDNV